MCEQDVYLTCLRPRDILTSIRKEQIIPDRQWDHLIKKIIIKSLNPYPNYYLD